MTAESSRKEKEMMKTWKAAFNGKIKSDNKRGNGKTITHTRTHTQIGLHGNGYINLQVWL